MKKLFTLMLSLMLALSLVGCSNSGNSGVTYTRADDDDIYNAHLGDYESLIADAKQAESIDEKFVLFAQAEAKLLDSAVMLPTTTKGGNYAINRTAPRTVPYVQWGNDDDRVKGLVISDEFLTKEERAELMELWSNAMSGNGVYDPAAYLVSKGHTLQKEYRTTFATAPVTLDWLNTSSQADTEVTVNTVDGLVEYNNLNQLTPALAESWETSEDGLTYTFHIRPNVYWYTSEGAQYAEVTARDFEAGFHHMLDAAAGLEWLVEGVITGVSEYLHEGGSFDNVGYKAVDDRTLEVTLCAPTSYFLTMLTYSCFMPMCESFFESRGGVFGIEEYADAALDTNAYTFGKVTDVASQVYNGAFLLQSFNEQSEITLVRNPGYYKASEVTLDQLVWVYDAGDNPDALYADTVAGVYPGIGLGEASGLLAKAKADGNFDKYGFVTDTTSTTYFGGLNLDRGTFALESGAVASPKNEQQKIDTFNAMQNEDFRKAVLFAWDKSAQNAVSVGEDLKLTSIRNMYTHPEFVSLSEDVTVDGKTWNAGTFYGEMVQYYLTEAGSPVQVADGVNGWYHPEEAKAHLEAAKEALGDTVSWPIQLDVVYYSASDNNTAQANVVKESIETVLGAENVQINLVESTTTDDYYASGYRASNGEAGNFDIFYGSGWGPDYGDPSTYLDTFLGGGAGYMTKVVGLY